MNGALIALTPQPGWTGKLGCVCGNLIPYPEPPAARDVVECLVCKRMYMWTPETRWERWPETPEEERS